MAHRAFTDATGVDWQVWAVTPQWADRRTGAPRRTRSVDDPDVDPPVIEHRRNPDRRKGLPDQFRRVRLAGGLENGWLAFESSNERRRLAPIPAGWENVPEQELESLCRNATTTGAVRRLSD